MILRLMKLPKYIEWWSGWMFGWWLGLFGSLLFFLLFLSQMCSDVPCVAEPAMVHLELLAVRQGYFLRFRFRPEADFTLYGAFFVHFSSLLKVVSVLKKVYFFVYVYTFMKDFCVFYIFMNDFCVKLHIFMNDFLHLSKFLFFFYLKCLLFR